MIDTGCDTADYAAFLSTLDETIGPFYVVNTHIHFDHISGNHRFQNSFGSMVMQGNANPKFSGNYALTSLCCAHPGCRVSPFKVNRWLSDGDCVSLGPKADKFALAVLHTPGHSIDSISLFMPSQRRLFVGDLMYPFTAVPLSSVGASLDAFLQSTSRLLRFVKMIEAGLDVATAVSLSVKSGAGGEERAEDSEESGAGTRGQDGARKKGQSSSDVVDLTDENGLAASFAAASAVAISANAASAGASRGSAIEIDNASDEEEDTGKGKGKPSTDVQGIVPVLLSCGHVSSDLEARSALEEVIQLASLISKGAIQPVRMEADGVGEFTTGGSFSLLVAISEIKSNSS